MKNFYTCLIALFIGSFGFSQGTEDFGNLCTSGCSPSNSSYASRSWTGQDGSTWTATNSRTDQSLNGNAITMNDDNANTFVQSGTISGGIGDITITTQRKFSGGSGDLDILINGTSVGTVPYSGSSQTTTISGVNISGDIVIRIDNNIGGSSGGGADRVAIDDIIWTGAAGSTETVDFCNLQFPGSATITEGSTFDAFAQIFEAGTTEAGGQGANIDAWIGVSSTNATTSADFTSSDWTWTPMTYFGDSGNNDEYSLAVGASLSPGNYFYVSRFSVDGGPFAYGGINTSGSGGNFWDGTSFISGVLTVDVQIPTTNGTLTINGCGASDTFNTAYDASTQGIVWVELIYDGNCTEITLDTENSDFDTELGLYDANGTLIASNDDDTGGITPQSLVTESGLAAGTYYLAAGRFNVTFGTFFDVTTNNSTTTGTLHFNASTPNFVDFCNLQFPGTETITAGNTFNAFAQIFEAGNTAGAGAGTNITAEFGISTVNATSIADFESSDWTWSTATYFGEDGNNDEYSAALGASLTPGTYYYVSRFSVDGSVFAYGGNDITDGIGGNFWDGTDFVSGVLTVEAQLPDFCNLQFPGTATITAGNTFDAFAQIFEAGNTPGAGAGTNITAEFGISVVNASSTADFESSDWTWSTATYFGEIGNNDEYFAALGASLTPGTYYYVSRFSVDGGPFAYGGNDITDGIDGNFWDGTDFVSGVLTVNPAPEPTNHVLNFTAIEDSSSQITLTWNDNDGGQVADGFLIVGKTGAATYFSPVDGTDPTDDTDWSDNEFEVKVASSTETYTVTGLTASTLYEFRIYPYTNTGANIDFKTDGVIPEANATTLLPPPFIIEDFDDGNFTANPVWSGNTSNFSVITDATIPNGNASADGSYLASNASQGDISLSIVSTETSEWEFSLASPNFSPSSSNNFGVVLMANAAFTGSLSGSNFQGYYIRIGSNGGTDNLELWRKTGAGQLRVDAFPSSPNFGSGALDDGLNIKITRSASGEFELFYSTGFEYSTTPTTSAGTITDNTYSESTYFGVFQEYSNTSASRRVYFDNLEVSELTYKYDGAWSPSDPNGVSNVSQNIVIESDNAIISANTSINAVTVNPGASLTIDSGVTLNANTTTLESISTSYSSLISNGIVSGVVQYQRYVNTNNAVNGNDLISAPLSGQAFNVFIDNNTNILANPNGPEILFGGFDNTSTSAPFELWDENDTTLLEAGKGYRSGITEGESSNLVTFEGTVNSTTVGVPINQGSASKLNLIGNPFPSYLDAQAFLTRNASLLEPSAQVIYGYNDSTDGTSAGDYTIISALLNNTLNIAPGQGFFVTSNTTGGNIEFTTSTPEMRLASGGDDFITGRNSSVITNLKLELSNVNDSFITDIFFTEFSSLGLDPGYDASLLGGVAPSFSVFSQLVQDDSGVPFAVQALGELDYGNVTVPLGVNANQGEQLTFSITNNSLPITVEVYLDDTEENSSTLLNSGDYIITPNANLSGIGRFYLRFTDSALSTNENSLNDISIHNDDNQKRIIISGQLTQTTTANLYDLQGRKVISKNLISTSNSQVIDVSDLSAGVYVVQLQNTSQTKTQKVIIR